MALRQLTMAAGLALVLVPLAPWPVGASTSSPTVQSRSTPTGAILTNAAGRTLYVFVDDLLTKDASACTGDCANDWPPALAPRTVVVGRGVTGKVGTVTRTDGRRQLTMDGRPLYTFSGDRKPGDLRGNGVGNRWWAMTPTGLTATLFALPHATFGASAATTLTVVHTASGPVVADSRGQVLYDYTDDRPTKSACVDDWCLVDWPPLQANGASSAAAGITAAVGVLDRPDGVDQVELGGHPLYTFAGDLHPGDTRGQGVGGDWYLVSPSGSTVKPTDGNSR